MAAAIAVTHDTPGRTRANAAASASPRISPAAIGFQSAFILGAALTRHPLSISHHNHR